MPSPSDFTIASQIRGPEVSGGASAPTNPLTMGLDLLRMQELANQNRKFQLEQWANQGMAEIMSRHSGDEEGGLREILASPFAPYGASFANTVRASNASLAATGKALAETGRINFETNDTVMHSLAKYLGPTYNAILNNRPDEEVDGLTKTAVQSVLSSVSGMTELQKRNAINGMQAVIQGINANLPADPAAARQLRLDRISNLMPASGMDAAAMDRILSKPEVLTTPQGLIVGSRNAQGVFVPQAPFYPGGPPGFIPSGYPPHLGSPGEVPYPGSAGPLPSGNLLGGAPTGAPPATSYFPTPTPAPAPAGLSMANRIAGSGKPLWTPDMMAQSPSPGGWDASGTRWVWQDPEKGSQVQEAMNKFIDKENPRYESAKQAMIQFDSMDSALNTIANTKLAPGTWAQQRYEAVKAVNTVAEQANRIFGTNLGKLEDNASLASYENFVKEAVRAQFQVVSTQFGYQREAGSVVAAAGRAVPDVEKTLMGDKLVLENLRSATQRTIDQHEFQMEWARTHHQDLANSEVKFNQAHPTDNYSQRTLAKFGLTKDGFGSLNDIRNAAANLWIDPQTAATAAQRWTEQQRVKAENP